MYRTDSPSLTHAELAWCVKWHLAAHRPHRAQILPGSHAGCPRCVCTTSKRIIPLHVRPFKIDLAAGIGDNGGHRICKQVTDESKFSAANTSTNSLPLCVLQAVATAWQDQSYQCRLHMQQSPGVSKQPSVADTTKSSHCFNQTRSQSIIQYGYASREST